jgi:hypothetical protein
MNPFVRRDLALFSQLDHVNSRLVSPRATRSATKRRFKLPDRRIARSSNRIKRNAGLGFASMAFHFQPSVAAVQALPDGWRGLRRSAVAFHSDRPRICFRAISLTDGLYSLLASMFSADLRASDLTAPYNFARLGAHGAPLQRALRGPAMPLGFDLGTGRRRYRYGCV